MAMRVLVSAPLMPEWDRESGSKRILHHLLNLRAAGCAVSFVAENPNGEDRYTRALQQQGIAVYRGFGEATDELYQHGGFDAAIFAFWYLAEQQMPRLRAVSPRTRILVDSIDVHFLRNARRMLQVSPNTHVPGQVDAEYASEAMRELNAYAAADGVLTVSQKEADLINDFLGRQGHAVSVADSEDLEPSRVPLKSRLGTLFIGNFRHPPNLQAAEYLCRDIVPRIDPKILRRHPISIVGNALPDSVRKLAAASGGAVRAVGWVPSLVPYLHQARITAIPLLYGAGTKRKLIQPLMTGTPTVSTSIGAEGFDLTPGEHILIGDDADTFARHIETLLTDDRKWNAVRAAASAHIRRVHSRDVAAASLVRAVRNVCANAATFGRGAGYATDGDYRAMVSAVRTAIASAVPPSGTVAVISRGDTAFTAVEERNVLHFPQQADGTYAGYHPADDRDALDQLAAVHGQGARYLVVPRNSDWWLEHYAGFRDYLCTVGREIRAGDSCSIFELPPRLVAVPQAANG